MTVRPLLQKGSCTFWGIRSPNWLFTFTLQKSCVSVTSRFQSNLPFNDSPILHTIFSVLASAAAPPEKETLSKSFSTLSWGKWRWGRSVVRCLPRGRVLLVTLLPLSVKWFSLKRYPSQFDDVSFGRYLSVIVHPMLPCSDRLFTFAFLTHNV